MLHNYLVFVMWPLSFLTTSVIGQLSDEHPPERRDSTAEEAKATRNSRAVV